MTTVALLSDVHMRDEHAAAVGAELDAVIDELEAAAPARAFVLGDLIEDGASPERDAANVRAVRDRLSAGEFPVTYLLGNHDVENLDRATLSDLLGQGSFRRVERVDGTPFVCLDSTRDGGCGARGALGAEQVAWLRETLPGLADPIVLTHHPVGDFDLSGNDWFRRFPERAFLGDRKELLESSARPAPRGGRSAATSTTPGAPGSSASRTSPSGRSARRRPTRP